jgi:hypothetical protein
VCFELLGPVENMQRKEGLRGFYCMKSEGVGMSGEGERESDSTRFDLHFMDNQFPSDLTHLWTSDGFCNMQRKISACYSESPCHSLTASVASTQRIM